MRNFFAHIHAPTLSTQLCPQLIDWFLWRWVQSDESHNRPSPTIRLKWMACYDISCMVNESGICLLKLVGLGKGKWLSMVELF